MTRDTQASTLRHEWCRLQAEGALLADAAESLETSEDLGALCAHQTRLLEHEAQVLAFTEAMDAFHDIYGPSDGLGTA